MPIVHIQKFGHRLRNLCLYPARFFNILKKLFRVEDTIITIFDNSDFYCQLFVSLNQKRVDPVNELR
jgi:hypothetical protein